MKNLIAMLIVLYCAAGTGQVYAQLSKEEQKEWKKKRKATTPEQLKRLMDENASLKSEVGSLNGQVASLQASFGERDARIAEMTERNRSLESQLAQARAAAEQTAAPASATEGRAPADMSGVVFKVQIGAFRNKDLSKYFNNTENFTGEVDADGTQKVTLGIFRDYWEADTFKKYLREMGVHDAWIVPYKNGTRVEMKDVLEGVI
jgi:hypothetical protein